MEKQIKRVILLSLMLNIILTIIKLGIGVIGNSVSLTTDGINSLFDCLLSVVMFFVMRQALKKADSDHPYGHEKYEGFLNVVLSLIMLATAFVIIGNGLYYLYIAIFKTLEPSIVSNLSLYAALVSMAIKGVLVWLNVRASKRFNSAALNADAKNHLSDILATLASVIGIISAMVGFYEMEYIASVLIGFVILYTAYQTLREAKSFLVDEAPEKEVIQTIKTFIINIEGVKSIDDFKIRKHMMRLYVDIEIGVDYTLSLLKAHAIAERVHFNVEKEFPSIIHCMVHVNPNHN